MQMEDEKPQAIPVDSLLTEAMDRLKQEQDPDGQEDDQDTAYMNLDYLP